VVPSVLPELLHDKDARKSKNVMEAMMQMEKLDIETLRSAYHVSERSADCNFEGYPA
jgi:hypothetical protein